MTRASIPGELVEAWDRLEQLGWRQDRIESVRTAAKGERNRVFVVSHDGTRAIVRLVGRKPGAKAASNIDRRLEIHNLTRAAKAGVTPAPIFSDPSDGLLVLPFIEGAHPVRRKIDSESAVRIAVCLRKLHEETDSFMQGTDFLGRIRKRVEKVASNEAEANRHSAGLAEAASKLAPLLDVLKLTTPSPVPCHGDLVLENIIDDGTRVYLVDWETSTAGDPHQDAGTVLLRARFSKAARNAFLAAYLAGRNDRRHRAEESRIYLWQVARALDKALIYWRNGQRNGKVDPRVDAWTRRCAGLINNPKTTMAVEYLQQCIVDQDSRHRMGSSS